jgi:hypothetical protein
MAASFRHLKNFLIGGGLAGCGYACMQAAPRVENMLVFSLLFLGGLAALIVGVRMLWIAYRKDSKMGSKSRDEEKPEPPSAL